MVLLALNWLRSRWLQILVHAGALLPLAWIAWHYARGLFLIDPVREITTLTGRGALILLMLMLACTPISTVFGLKQVRRLRRPLGLYALVYASVHFATFVWLDYGFDFDLLIEAIFAQRYVVVGFASGLILLALAITSTQGWQERLGKNWKRLHRLVYLAGILAVVHFAWLTKDIRVPLRYGIVLALLLALRIPPVRRAVRRARDRLRRRLSSAFPSSL
jgi:sulfoxide reductase heme-binding subunit YedZ